MAFSSEINEDPPNYSLHCSLRMEYTTIVRGEDNYLFTKDGRKIFDAASGAAVSCLGYRNERVNQAIVQLLNTGIPYLASAFLAARCRRGVVQRAHPKYGKWPESI